MRFKYIGIKDGKKIEGIQEAKDRFELYSALKNQGIELVRVDEDKPRFWEFRFWNERLSSVGEQEKIVFAQNMATMLSAGVSLSRAIYISKKQSKNPKFRAVLEDLAQKIESGEEFYKALSYHKNIFPDIFIAMVRAGELSGNLPEALRSIAKQLERVNGLKRKIKGAMIYPAIILFAIFAVGVFMMAVVVPKMTEIFKDFDAELPATTKFIIAVSDFLSNNLSVFLLTILAVFLIVWRFLKSKSGKEFSSRLILKLPIFGLMSRELNTSYLARTLASLLKSGLGIVESIEMASKVVQNTEFKKSLQKVAESVQKGKLLHESLREYEDLYPTMFVELLAVGEETGSIVEMSQNVADYFEEIVDEKAKNMSKIVEPALMLIIGVAVGFFAYAMILPMYSITQHV